MSDTQISGEIRPVPLAEALAERYMSYAMSTITSRSLPDVRDGLKPVHRRLLHAMRELRLNPDTGFKKCARIVGDVMGKYHPHGDAAIYDAMVRLAQDFAVRYPLVDGQGNFGNIDGDNAAAMRYTEARMTEVARRLLEGIDEDAVDFRDTYDGEGSEPLVLPANFPNLLGNGAAGIAVGMATSIPPHNVAEVCDALLHMTKPLKKGIRPQPTFEKLSEFISGPDFPTGGLICENRADIVSAYRTGRGGFRIRAKWGTEYLKGGAFRVVITEIPYQVQKSKLIEKIAELLHNRQLTMLDDIRDESTDQVRLVLEPRTRNVDPVVLMESLFRQTDLETRFSFNMNVLDCGRVPRVMNLREVLQAYLDHRHDVLVRRKRFRLGKIEYRLEILDGYFVAYLNIDEVIRIIREEDSAKSELIKAFKLSELQADAILNMRLRHLRKLEEMEIRDEHATLVAEQKEIKSLLKNTSARWNAIEDELKELRKIFGSDTEIGRRRTEIADAPSEVVIPLEAVMEREPVTVVCSMKGWVRAIKGHIESENDLKFKEGDRLRFALHAQTTDKLLVFATNGRFYTLGVNKLPGGRGHGEPLRLMFDLAQEHDIAGLSIHRSKQKILVVASDGRGFVVNEDDLIAQTRNGKQVLNVTGNTEGQTSYPIQHGHDHVAVVGENRKLLLFPLSELPEMTRGRGNILQRYKDGGLNDAKTFKLEDGLTWKLGERTRTETQILQYLGKRAGAGLMAPRGFPRDNKFGA
tara:strand:- start:904 stop:3153 length:2250 start_codon:yes stop_codon:yes gene_type:complete